MIKVERESSLQPLLVSILYRLACIILLTLCLISSADATSQMPEGIKPIAERVVFTHLTVEKLSTVGYVKPIAQDAHGYIWFGGINGLARYDGYELKIFTHIPSDSHSLSNSSIIDMKVDRQGRFWIATKSGIDRYSYEYDHFERVIDLSNYDNLIAPLEQSATKMPNSNLCLWVDDKDDLWVGTATSGLLHYSLSTKIITQHKPEAGGMIDQGIYTIYQGEDGYFWLGMNNVSLSRFDPSSNKFVYFPSDALPTTKIGSNQVSSLWVENNSQMWIGSVGGGLKHFNMRTGMYYSDTRKEIASVDFGSFIRAFYEDRSGELWIAADKSGVFRYSAKTKKIIHYQHHDEFKNSLANGAVFGMFEDKAGDMWFGLHPSGVDVIHRNTPYFENYRHNSLKPESLLNNDILSIIEGKNGDLWIGTERGVTRYDAKGGHTQHFIHNPHNINDTNSLPAEAALVILEDSHDEIWISTWNGGLSRYNKKNKKFVHYFVDANNPHGISDNRIWDIKEDDSHVIWLGNERTGVSKYNRESDTFTHYRYDPNDDAGIAAPGARHLYEDSHSNLWIGTSVGLDLYNKATDKFTHYRHDENNLSSLSNAWVKAILEDSSGRLWVGTQGGGLNLMDKKTKSFRHFGVSDGLADDVVTGLLEDAQGFIWISGGNGLSRLNPATMKFKNYDVRHGLPGNLFNRNANVRRANGDIVFGSSEGFTVFNPAAMEDNLYAPPVIIHALNLFNHPVNINDLHSPLVKMLSETKKITLSHQQSVFTLDFIALNYRFAQKNQYAYKLKGFDKDWNYIGTKRSATYTNLDPGDYIFQVKAANDEGLWNEEGASLEITVLPPIWKSWAAYVLYVITAFILIAYFLWVQRKKLREAQLKIEKERLIVEQLRTLDRLKENFLANTSHELRTPLNGIIGLAESIVGNNTALPVDVNHKVQMILSSGKRLANTVNDILEFSQLANNELTLELSVVELRPLVVSVVDELQFKIQDKSLVIFNEVEHNAKVYSNQHRLSQIIYHILDNAIKFTRDGSICIEYQQEENFDCISVTDTGIGISSENLAAIFTAFQQLEGSAQREVDGAGLGLSVIQKLVALHKGDIQVQSVVHKGSTFTIRLPRHIQTVDCTKDNSDNLAKNVSLNVQLISEPEKIVSGTQINSQLLHNSCVQKEVVAQKKYTVLVVDDDQVNRMVVKAHLRNQHFDFVEAGDGDEALNLINKNHAIDLIILDVMMPHITGYETCARLRKMYSSRQLPVIFLTANHQSGEINKAFEAGGNDFLTKPVSGKVLVDKVLLHLAKLDEYRNESMKHIDVS